MQKSGGPAVGNPTYVLTVYALLAFFSLLIFGSLQILVEHQPFAGYLELAGASAVGLVLLGLRVTGNVDLSRFCLLATVIAMLVVMLTTGGTEGTGILWFYMFPVAAFFLAGKREGTYWIAALVAVVLSTWAAVHAWSVPFYYADITVRQLLVTLIVVSTGVYVYQRTRERWEALAAQYQHELQSYLRHMTALHDKVDRAKSEFVTLASHQLRTPIAAIAWQCELMLAGDLGKLKDDQRDYIAQIEHSNKRMAALVNAMLTVSNLELGNITVRPELVDLAALSKQLFAAELRAQPQHKELHVRQTYDPKLRPLPTDLKIIQTILQNLFSNAIKYTPSGGSIHIRIAHHGTKLSAADHGTVLIEVTDTGFGIPKSQQSKIFTKLFRADNVTPKDTDGTGLGLFIAKAITEHIGGRLWFESQENKGSTFSVRLPIRSAPKKLL